jgi:hypothetical protein
VLDPVLEKRGKTVQDGSPFSIDSFKPFHAVPRLDPVLEKRVVKSGKDFHCVQEQSQLLSSSESRVLRQFQVLDPVLEKRIVKSGKGFKIALADKEVDYSPSFQLYLTTRLPNPHFTPELSAKVSGTKRNRTGGATMPLSLSLNRVSRILNHLHIS